MVALDLDLALLDRAAAPAELLQVGGDPLQLLDRAGNADDDADDLAAASGLLAEDPDDSVVGDPRPEAHRVTLWEPTLAGVTPVAAVAGVDETRVGHGRIVMLGRYAPSPTGDMHLGNARTALLAWLQARAAGGRIALRIDDLDRERCRPEFEDGVRDDLAWLGLDWDVETARQSASASTYERALDALRTDGLVYECFCTRAEVRAAASAPHGAGADGARYPGTCRDLTAAERAKRIAAGRPASLRLAVPPGAVGFDDLVHGPISQDVAATVGDFIVRRADGLHAYQLAVVVDDAAIGVTDVLRGDDLLHSTPRQVLLQRLLGTETPRYAHVPLMYAGGGERLAKRHASATLRSLRDAGRAPEAIVGDLTASLGIGGGAPTTPRELIGQFSLDAIRGTITARGDPDRE